MGTTRRTFTVEYGANPVVVILDEARSVAEAARNIDVREMA